MFLCWHQIQLNEVPSCSLQGDERINQISGYQLLFGLGLAFGYNTQSIYKVINYKTIKLQKYNFSCMHNYNVASRFATKTKIGNWYEQQELGDHQFKEYLYQKQNNNNLALATTQQLAFSNQDVQLSPMHHGLVSKGALKLGESIQLENVHTQSMLAFNIGEAVLGEETYAVTTSQEKKPALRNVFSVELAQEEHVDYIRFGDKIRLTTHIGNRKLYLQSLPVSPTRSSKFSRQQQVSVTANLSSNSIWVIQKVDAKERFDSVGHQIAQNEAILLKHLATGQWLASETVKHINQFGVEYEVFAKSYLANNKTQNLFAQKQGHRGATNAMRSQGIQNEWVIRKG